MKTTLVCSVLFCSFALSAQWGQVNAGITNISMGAKVLGHSGRSIFCGTLNGAKMYRSADNGNNWSEITTPVAGNVPECGFYAGTTYYSGLNAASDCIYTSTNEGNTWAVGSGGPTSSVVRGFISAGTSVFAYTSNKGVYKSSDNGATWLQVNSGLTNLNVIWMESITNKIIAATIGAGVFVSNDNGNSWAASNTGISGGALNASFIWKMAGSLYYYEPGGTAYKSTDDAATWTAWTKPTFFGLGLNEVYRRGSNLYIETRFFSGGLRDSVFVSTNEGQSWSNITANLSASDLNASGLLEFNGFAFISYNLISPNLGVYRYVMPVGLNKESVERASVTFFPNPTKDVLLFSSLNSDKLVTYTIISALGKELKSGILNSEENKLDISELAEGTYYLCVHSPNINYYKIIKQ